jgi:hypothetical protein
MFDFPASPTVGQVYTLNGVSYVWNGYAWMAADAAQAAAPVLAGRNKIINGSMRVNQRVTESTVAAGGFVADRWTYNTNIAANATFARSSNGAVSQQGPYHIYLITTTVKASLAVTDYIAMATRLEGYDIADLKWGTADAKPVTISFRAYATQATTITVTLGNVDSTRSYCAPVALIAGMGSYTVTVPGCTTGTWETTNLRGLNIGFTFAGGTNYLAPAANTWHSANYIAAPGQSNGLDTLNRSIAIADVQIEAGPVATPFEFRSIADEMIRCLRYYEKSYDYAVVPGTATSVGMHYASSSGTAVRESTRYMATKRAAPVMTFYSPTTGASGVIDAGGVSTAVPGINNGLTGFTMSTTGTDNQYVGYQWTANAEL